ncbi:O-antigen ligase family protein [Sphaerisporangium album]|uniref:O-antigen ligase family protein n=1 Tax=Sphaerisporangium album TaxID=509200 RepID=UPI0015F0A11E|nr:O-antigen ligase family protein [Sphaerisporangium album]
MTPPPPRRTGPVRMPSPAAWPIAAFLVGYPVWWALGFGGLSIIVVACPMAVVLWRRRPITVPKGMGLWMLLIAGYLVSAVMLDETPPGTYGELGTGRVLGYTMRLALYLALMIMVLYLGNLTERELPQRALVGMLGVLFLTTVAGGLLGVFAPRLEFTSPVESILPSWISGNSYVRNLIHPTAAQIQHVLGHAAPRPEAPFEWANAWGGNLSVLLIWFVVGWWTWGGPARRAVCVAVVALSAIPIVYSLNRGLWAGLAVSAAYVLVRVRPRRGFLVGAGLACGALVLAAGPLTDIVAQRLDKPHSNRIRAFTVTTTLEAATHSPFIGYGNTRNAFGSYQTITTGKTDWCAECGHPPLGSDGQLWLLLITQGFTGAALYIGFFAGAIRRFRHDRTPIGQAGTLVMILVLLYMFIYDGLVTALGLYLISYALLWRNGHRPPPPAIPHDPGRPAPWDGTPAPGNGTPIPRDGRPVRGDGTPATVPMTARPTIPMRAPAANR